MTGRKLSTSPVLAVTNRQVLTTLPLNGVIVFFREAGVLGEARMRPQKGDVVKVQ